jgi:hypothetical protein
MCDGAREYRCWNGISLDAGLACGRMLAMVFDGLMELQGFDDALVAKLQEEYAQLDIDHIRTVHELEQKLSQIQKFRGNNRTSLLRSARTVAIEL